jgi:D-glycero-alpha-D-manno-heptose 1-phosphate guanylyltransferase
LLKEAIILAGGLGTRLRDTVPGLPKCMAPVAAEPFLTYVIRHLLSQGIERFIFSLGYKHEIIETFLEERFGTINYQCVIEDEPLGTGGAIKLALEQVREKEVLVVNGDTLFKIEAKNVSDFHQQQNAECTIVLKPMKNFDRYGVVELEKDHHVKSFREKKQYTEGLINGGIYVLDVAKFMTEKFPSKFSFEKDYLEKFYSLKKIAGFIQDKYFIDIGIPEDYTRAQTELAYPKPDLNKVDKSWTLFLDRDGVINHEKFEDYILNKTEFRFFDGVHEAMKILAPLFRHIIIISNQRGIGKGLMTEDDLADIHLFMNAAIETAGGRIDRIYYCTSTERKNFNRKPNPGMALEAKLDFPDIDFSKTIIAGNKLTDMLFGRNAGIHTVFIASTNPEVSYPHPDIDLRFNSLLEFAKAL